MNDNKLEEFKSSDAFEKLSKENPESTPEELYELWNRAVMARNIVCTVLFLAIIVAASGYFGAPIGLIAIFILLLIPLCFEATRKAIGLLNIVLGVIVTITGVGALIGIAMIIFGFIAFFWKDKD